MDSGGGLALNKLRIGCLAVTMAVSLPLWVSALFESGGFFAAETGSFFFKSVFVWHGGCLAEKTKLWARER